VTDSELPDEAPSGKPAPLEPSDPRFERMQSQIDTLAAALGGAKSLDTLVAADDKRRDWSYWFYLIGAALPVISIVYLSTLAWLICQGEATGAGQLAQSTLGLWIFFALPVVGSLLTGAACFAVANRLQMPTADLARIDTEKARASTKSLGSVNIDPSKLFSSGDKH
jgi:hypothetical protein